MKNEEYRRQADLAQMARNAWEEAERNALAKRGYDMGVSSIGITAAQGVVLGQMGQYYAPASLPADLEKIRALEAKVAELEETACGHMEIIEALASDAMENETLREENARLKIIGCLKVRSSISDPTPPVVTDGWHPWLGSAKVGVPHPPVRRGLRLMCCRRRDGEILTGGTVETWRWDHRSDYNDTDIVAYKAVPE